MGQLVNRKLNVFTLETAINNRMYGGMLDFLHKNEDHFSDWDRARLKTSSGRWAMSPTGCAARACTVTPRRTG